MPSYPPSPDGPEDRAEKRLEELRGGGVGKGLGAGGKYAGMGLQFAVSILLFLYAGQWLDKRLGSSPVFLIIGVFTGAGAAFYAIYRTVMAEERAASGRGKDQGEGEG